MMNLYRILTTGQNATIIDAGINYAIRTGITAVVCIIMTSTYITCFNIAAENQVCDLKSFYLSKSYCNRANSVCYLHTKEC